MPLWRLLHTSDEKHLRVFIYALVDPRNEELFYIGKTRNELRKRLDLHNTKARKGDKTPNASRILEILNSGNKPKIILLEETTMEKFGERERSLIAEYKALGYNLANVSPGGGGML
jgi:hypothetical protein